MSKFSNMVRARCLKFKIVKTTKPPCNTFFPTGGGRFRFSLKYLLRLKEASWIKGCIFLKQQQSTVKLFCYWRPLPLLLLFLSSASLTDHSPSQGGTFLASLYLLPFRWMKLKGSPGTCSFGLEKARLGFNVGTRKTDGAPAFQRSGWPTELSVPK